jgi:hypothetical protein
MLKGNRYELCEFEILTQGSSLFPTQDVIRCVRDTEVAVHTFFKDASIQANICKL